MSIWIEIHCDIRSTWPKEERGHLDSLCYSDRNDNAMAMAGNPLSSVLNLMKILRRRAKEQGWTFSRGKWCCPGCRE